LTNAPLGKFVVVLVLSLGILSTVMLLSAPEGDGIQPPKIGPGFDASQIKGPNECVECHKHSGSVWEKTPHATTITDMPRSEEGRDIAKKMGIRRIKSESLCLDCHSTAVPKEGKLKPISGVSCESCHGASEPWLKRHGEFSGKKEGEESAEEIASRWAECESAGMLRAGMILEIARNCVSCHVVPDEKLVNVGGHSSGSDFELVSWSQGVIRHNNWYSKGTENKIASKERQRVLYVVGTLVELETTLRCLATASTSARYAKKNARRVDHLRKRLAAIAAATPVNSVVAANEAVTSLRLVLSNRKEISSAADAVQAASEKFVDEHDGVGLEALDPLIPPPEDFRGGEPGQA